MFINSSKKIIRVTTYLSILLFAISMTQKSYCIGSDCGDSIMCLLIVWLGVCLEFVELIEGVFNLIIGKGFTANPMIGATFSWLANPFIFLSLIVIRKNVKASLILSSISTIFILSFLLFDSIFANEAGYYHKITSYESGYWLWLTSSLVIFFGSLILTNIKKELSLKTMITS